MALLVVGASVLNTGGPARAQVRNPEDTISAGEDAGPLSDVSRPLRDDSASVHDGLGTIGENSAGPVRSGPVRDGRARSMLSGPVSEVSQGPMTEPRPPLTSGAVAEASAGAVKHDIASPLGERISEPLRELGALRAQMRARRKQAEKAALVSAGEPAVPSVDEAAAPDAAAAAESTTAPGGESPHSGAQPAAEVESDVAQDGDVMDPEGGAPPHARHGTRPAHGADGEPIPSP